MPYDDRVSLLGISWMYTINEQDADFEQSKSILLALFYRSRNTGDVDWKELAEFVLERLTEDPVLIFNFLKPQVLFRDLLVFVAVFGWVKDVFRLIRFCIDNVPKSDGTVAALEEALQVVLEDQSLDYGQRRREFDADENRTASALLAEVRALPNR